MRYPEFLKENGRIGFIAPSFGASIEPYVSCFTEALRRFESLGYTFIEGPNCRRGDGIGKSSTPENCGAEINDFFTNDRSDIIISCGGGETMCEDLSFVDFDAIAKAEPKWFMGYSDNTNLILTLPTLCDTAAVYGPNASSFGQRPWHQSIHDALNLLSGEQLKVHNYPFWEIDQLKAEDNPCVPYNCTEAFDMKFAGSARSSQAADFSGRLLGGCLDCLQLLCGTRFDRVREFAKRYENDGIVWFIESCDLSSVGVRRALWALKEAGWFDTAKGFIFGRPYLIHDESFGLSQEQAVTGILGDLHVPILLNTDIGHLPPQMPLIAGAFAEVSARPGKLEIRHILK